MFHVMSRAVEGQDLFLSDSDYALFLSMVERVQKELPFLIHFFCLMPNHFHFLIELLDASMSKIMQRLKTAYAMHFNQSLGRRGALFGGRYPAKECLDGPYYAALARYITRNPVKAGLVGSAAEWPWSSHRQIVERHSGHLAARERALRFFGPNEAAALSAYQAHIAAPDSTDDALFALREFPWRDDRAVYAPWAEVELQGALMNLAVDICGRSGYDIGTLRKARTRAGVALRTSLASAARDLGFTLADVAAFLDCAPSTLSRALGPQRTQGV